VSPDPDAIDTDADTNGVNPVTGEGTAHPTGERQAGENEDNEPPA
jgi:hypothetical protein